MNGSGRCAGEHLIHVSRPCVDLRIIHPVTFSILSSSLALAENTSERLVPGAT